MPGDYLLLVEDNPGDAALTRALLRGSDPLAPELRWVPTLGAALHMLAHDLDCTAVLLDLGLPDSDGLEGLAAVQPLAHDFPIIVLTGDGDESLGVQAVAAGAQDCLVKGRFDADELQRSIRFARQRKRFEQRRLDAERRAALDAAIAARDELREVLARIDDGFIALDTQWRYTYANPQAARLMRLPAAEHLIGRLLWDQYPKLAASPIGAALRSAMALQAPAVTEVFYPPWQRWFEIRMHPSGNGMTMYFSDITERRVSQQAILDFQAELSQLARKLLAQERDTTQRLAQALHDGLGQTLAVARLRADGGLRAQAGTVPAPLYPPLHDPLHDPLHEPFHDPLHDPRHDPLAQVGVLLDQAVREVREVLADLRPPYLEDGGLVAALDNEVRSHRAGGVDILLEVDDAAQACRWPGDVEYAAFMVAREAVANALLHAGATLVRVVLGGGPAALQLDVIDDGRGIEQPMRRGRPGHLGIVGMRERCIAIGAGFAVDNAAGGGAWVSLRWPAAAG